MNDEKRFQKFAEMINVNCEGHVPSTLTNMFEDWFLTGSRVAGEDAIGDNSDWDYACLGNRNNRLDIARELRLHGFEIKVGPGYERNVLYASKSDFSVFNNGKNIDLIISFNSEFFERFRTATQMIKFQNITDKTKRIELFKEILYPDNRMIKAIKDILFYIRKREILI